MNEEQLKIDVEAEQQILSTAFTTKPSDIFVQENENILPSFDLPESISISEQVQPNLELLKSISISEQVQPNLELLKSISISEQVQPNLELSESLLIEPTKFASVSTPTAEVSSVAMGLSVKFDAETSYNQLSKKINEIEENFENSSNLSSEKGMPYPKAQNKFEEKPTTDPTNLIFDDRMLKFSSMPIWA